MARQRLFRRERTTKALLTHWFATEHFLPQADGEMRPFAWFFAQREAVESAIWLYEIERARDPHSLIRYDSSRAVTLGMFAEDWTRYVLKLATGAGKTKVMSLLMTWSYFHKLYEEDSDLSTNFLLVAPNIIVLDRLRTDFDGARIFFDDPLLPDNGFRDRNWGDDFQMTVHLQDQVGLVADTLRNLSEVPVKNTLIETFKAAINALTVEDKGTTEIRDRIKLSRTRPYVAKEQPFLQPSKSLFNKVVGDSHFELEFAAFLDKCDDIIAFAKNDNRPDTLRIDYQNSEGGISHYVPDFLVKVSDNETWIVETKGREDLNDPRKWERLKQWCADATVADAGRTYKALFVDEGDWKKYRVNSFAEAQATYRTS